VRGIVTKVTKDGVMIEVEMQVGPFRSVLLMSREAADELGLDVGVLAIATVKSTQVIVELPEARVLQKADERADGHAGARADRLRW
jgi:molybdopterin-binding protein